MVVTRLPATAATGSTQLRVATPSKWTVHAPHCAMPQPNFVPVRPSVSRSTQSSGVSGLSVTERDLPLAVNVIGDIGGAPRGSACAGKLAWRPEWRKGRVLLRRRGGAGGGRCPNCIGRAIFPRHDHLRAAARSLLRHHGGDRRHHRRGGFSVPPKRGGGRGGAPPPAGGGGCGGGPPAHLAPFFFLVGAAAGPGGGGGAGT